LASVSARPSGSGHSRDPRLRSRAQGLSRAGRSRNSGEPPIPRRPAQKVQPLVGAHPQATDHVLELAPYACWREVTYPLRSALCLTAPPSSHARGGLAASPCHQRAARGWKPDSRSSHCRAHASRSRARGEGPDESVSVWPENARWAFRSAWSRSQSACSGHDRRRHHGLQCQTRRWWRPIGGWHKGQPRAATDFCSVGARVDSAIPIGDTAGGAVVAGLVALATNPIGTDPCCS
jgi:hypothetical protein